jgi:hypothetical protein
MLCGPKDASDRARTGDVHSGVDFGVNDCAAFDNGETIANPRIVHNEMPPHGGPATPAGEEDTRIHSVRAAGQAGREAA